jgi:hypothetical protein
MEEGGWREEGRRGLVVAEREGGGRKGLMVDGMGCFIKW